jgi:hypothetical protein
MHAAIERDARVSVFRGRVLSAGRLVHVERDVRIVGRDARERSDCERRVVR